MRPVLDETAVREHEDPVRRLRRREPVRDRETRPARGHALDGTAQPDIELGVDRARRLVEDQQVGSHEPGTHERDQLPLPSGQPVPTLTRPGVRPVGQGGEPVGQVECGERVQDAGVIRPRIPVADVVEERRVEQERVLGHEGDPTAQLGGRDVLERHAPEKDRARRRLLQASDDLHERRLPRAGAADDGDALAGRHVDADGVEDVRPIGVRVGEIAHGDAQRPCARTARTLGLGLGLGGAWRVEHVEHATQTGGGGLGLVEDLDEQLHRRDEQRDEQQERSQPAGRDAGQVSGRDADADDADRHEGREQLGRREQRRTEDPGAGLGTELLLEDVADVTGRALLDAVRTDRREPADRLARRRERRRDPQADPVVPACQHALRGEQRRGVDGGDPQHDRSEHRVEHDHEHGDDAELRGTGEHPDPAPLDELRDGLDVRGDPGDERAPTFARDRQGRDRMEVVEHAHAQFMQTVRRGAHQAVHRSP